MSICVFRVQISNFNIIYLKRISVPFAIPDILSTFALGCESVNPVKYC